MLSTATALAGGWQYTLSSQTIIPPTTTVNSIAPSNVYNRCPGPVLPLPVQLARPAHHVRPARSGPAYRGASQSAGSLALR